MGGTDSRGGPTVEATGIAKDGKDMEEERDPSQNLRETEASFPQRLWAQDVRAGPG